jgi:Fic family protein
MQGSQFETELSASQFESLDSRAEKVRALMEKASAEDIASLWHQLDVSAIYHDCALEGQVLSPEELNAAFNPRAVADASRVPLFGTLRSHRTAYDLMRQLAASRTLVFTLDLFKQFHQLFAADPVEARSGKFRAETPLHRSYFHEICEPDKIPANMRKLVAWMGEPPEEPLHPVEWASRFHKGFMRIFPYTETSGKVGRAVMNAILVHHGYLPAVIHATERQRYYEALRNNQHAFTELVIESSSASLDAASRFLRRMV